MHSKVPVFDLVNLDKTPRSGGQRGKPTTIILLNWHCIKLPHKYLSLYPEINSVLSPH